MSAELYETIEGPDGQAEIYKVSPGPIEAIVDAFDHAPYNWELKVNDRLIGYYDDLHEPRSEANDRVGNND